MEKRLRVMPCVEKRGEGREEGGDVTVGVRYAGGRSRRGTK
jgi:hypothetical protein